MEEELLQPPNEQKVAYGQVDEVDLNSVNIDLGPEVQTTQPEIVENKFKAPFNSSIGKSSVDLSIAGNNEKMLEEYNYWWHLGLCWGRVAEEH